MRDSVVRQRTCLSSFLLEASIPRVGTRIRTFSQARGDGPGNLLTGPAAPIQYLYLSSAPIAASLPKPPGSKTSLMNLRPTRRLAFRWALMSFTSVFLCACSRRRPRRAAVIREPSWTGPGPPRRRARSRSSRSQHRSITPTPGVLPGHRLRAGRARGPVARTARCPRRPPSAPSPVADEEWCLALASSPRPVVSDACLAPFRSPRPPLELPCRSIERPPRSR